MVQGEGTNPQVGKVTVEDFARRIKEKYPQYKDVDDSELTQRIIDKYPQYKETVSFEPTPVKKKDAAIPSAPSVGALPSQEYTEKDFFTGTFSRILKAVDRAHPWLGFGEAVDDIGRSVYRGYKQGIMSENASDLLLRGGQSTPEDIASFLKANKDLQEVGESEEFRDYQRIQKEEGGFYGVVKGIAANPTILPELIVSSLVGMASDKDSRAAFASALGTGAGTGAGVGAVAGGVGALPGAVAGTLAAVPFAFGAAGAAMEMGATFAELLQEELGEGVELTKENVKSVLEDKEAYKRIRNKSVARGLTIGTIDVFTGKLAGSVGAKILTKSGTRSISQAPKSAVLKSLGAATAIEGVGGSAGEAAARFAIGQDMDISEIALEGIAELPGGVINLTAKAISPAQYKINGEFVSLETAQDIIDTMTLEELNNAKISIKNDYTGLKSKVDQRKRYLATRKAIKSANPNLNQQQLDQITELQLEIFDLSDNKTEPGKEKTKSLKSQINEIANRVERTDDPGQDVPGQGVAGTGNVRDDVSSGLIPNSPFSIKTNYTFEGDQFNVTVNAIDKDGNRTAEDDKIVGYEVNVSNLNNEGLKQDNSALRKTFKTLGEAVKYGNIYVKADPAPKRAAAKKAGQKTTPAAQPITTGEEVFSFVEEITPQQEDVPTGFEGKIKERNFRESEVDLQELLNTDPDFKDFYDNFQQRYEEGEVDTEGLGLNLVVVDGELLDGYNRAATLLSEGQTKTNAFVAVDKQKTTPAVQPTTDTKTQSIQYTDQYNEDDVAVAEIDTTAIVENSKEETERVKQTPLEQEDGTTLNLDGTTYEGDGLVVSFESENFTSEEITPELIAKFIEKNKNKIPKGAKVVVGLYSFKGQDKVSIDLNVVIDENNLAVATEFARLMGQDSIFRLSDFETIKTGETGDNTVTLMDARARQAAIAITQGKLPQYLKGIMSPSEMATFKEQQDRAYKKSQEKPKKQNYVDVKDLGKDDRTPKRFTEKTVKKLQTMVDNFNKVLKKIGAQPYNITFAANNKQYEARYRELTGRKKSANRGTFIGSKREIIINLSSATEGTLAHEMMHAYLHALNITGKNILQLTKSLYTTLSRGSAIEKRIAKELRQFQDEYIRRNVYGQNKTLEDPNIAEEFLTEYVGIMVQYSDRIPDSGKVSFAEKVRKTILKFLTRLGIKDKSILQAIETREEAVNFINGFVNVLSDRAGVETLPTIDTKAKREAKDTKDVSKEQIEAIKIISSETPRQKAKKDAVAKLLNGFSENQLEPNSSEQDLISRFLSNIFEESSYTLKKGARESGMTWYIEDITEFGDKMKVLLPQLEDDNQMKLFKQVLAITSSGTNPNQNLQTAYTLWVRSNSDVVNFAKNWGEDKISFISKKGAAIGTGIIVRETKTKYIVQKVDALGNPEVFKNGTPKLFEAKKNDLKAGYPKPAGFTARGNIVAQQLKKIEKVYEDVGKDINKLIDFFENPQPVSKLRKYNKGVPDVDGNVRKVAVGKRNGAFIFGEKIGAFYQNMIGIGDTITMDLWWSRTWNRYMGTMLSTVDGKKVIQETPRTDRERDIMRKAVTLAAEKLNLDVSELQAVIWYFEQELWTKAGNVSPSFSYVTAVEALNSKIKTDEQTQKRFSEAGADLTAAEKRRQDAIARADNIIAEGGIQGDIDSKEQIDFAGIEMKVKETPGNTDPAIKTGGVAYVPVSKLYNLMDMRDGDRGGLYETARDKKRVDEIAERFKKEGFNTTDGWYQTIYVDIDAGGFGWIGEGNHRVLAARQLGMTHLPVRVEFGAARDGKFIYDKNYSRVPTQVVSKEKIAELKEKAGKNYHIKYASIWETNLPTNQEPSVVSKEQIDWQRSEFGRGQVNPAIVNRATPVQQAAIDLLEGKITNKEYQDIVKFTQPIEAITRFFLPASTKDMKESLDSNKAKLLNEPIEEGKEIGLRLDIPAYKNKNIWIVSIHDKGKAGKSISYGSVAWATDVTFGSNPKVAAFIAAGKNMDTLKKQDKTTIARMLGKWKNFEGRTKEEKDAAAIEKINEIVAIENKYPGANRTGSPWRQIGMNPFRHSFFYDRRNGKPVVYASEVVQIGGLVYAKDVVYADKTDPMFEVEGYKDAEGETVRFQIDEKTNEAFESRESIAKKIFGSDVDSKVDNQVSKNKSWKSRPRTAFEKFVDLTRLRIQDKFRRLIIVQEDIEHSSGKPVGLNEDFRNAEALMHGKAKEELNKSEEKVAKIAKLIKAAGIKIENFNELLYAMHAQERNRYLRIASTDVGASLAKLRKKLKIKPSEIAEQLGITTQEYLDIESNKEVLTKDNLKYLLQIYGTSSSEFFYENAAVKDGSGMTDKEARKILAEYGLDVVDPESSQLPAKLRAAVEAVYDLTADTRQRLLDSGLETPETIEAFEASYKNYVPLRGFAESFDEVDSEIIEGGRKIEVRGREKRAKGRKTKADDPLTQAIIANTTTIIRAEKNNVMNRFYNLAKNNPNEDVYKVIDPKINKEYKIQERGGKLVRTAKTISDYLLDPKIVAVRIDGEYKFIRFKDVRLAEALKGANVVKADFMVKYLGAFNRMLSGFITTYDPEFILRNFSRDIQTAVMNLYAEQEISEGLIKDKNIVAKVVSDTLPALRSIFAIEGGLTGKKKASKNKEMDQYYREFKEDGAKTEWFYSKSSSEVQNDIEKIIEGKGESSLKAALSLVERLNTSVENAVRLSTYVNARKAGVSRAKAAELAKGLTVNFNKSGEWGQIGNTLYLFFNASVQGTSRLIRALKPRFKVDSEGNRSLQVTTAQKIAIGLSILGSLLSLLNELSSEDDEDGESFYSKISDFEKERNIIIMKSVFGGSGKDYFKIPLPYGVNVFYVAGTLLADAAQKVKTPGQAVVGIMEAALGSFSPINFPTSKDVDKFLLKFITPTALQIPAALAINENYFGQTIYNKNFPFDTSPKPASELGRQGSNRWTQNFVKFMNKVTGGSEFRPGAIDVNPDKIDFVMESLSGGMGKFVGRSSNVIDKVITGNWDELEPRQIPFVRVFYGQTPKYANVQEFYSRSVSVNQMFEEVKAKMVTDPIDRKKISKMYYLGKNVRKQLRRIKEREDMVMKIKDPERQQAMLEKLESARYRIVANYNKQYTTFEIDKIK